MTAELPSNPHFLPVASWRDAASAVDFEPRVPADTLGHELQMLQIHVMDHRRRELPRRERSLEAYYEAFVFTQARRGRDEARRLALETSYGQTVEETTVRGHPARRYELGAEVPPDDTDGRPPSVVVWADGEMFYLVASGELPVADLERIAASI